MYQVLSRHVRDLYPDLVFISETLLSHSKMEIIRVRLGFSGKLVVNNVGRSGGLSLMWSDSISVSLLSYSNWHIDVMVTLDSGSCWRFSGMYGNPEAAQRVHSWELLRRLKGMSSLPWLIGGDFNEILRLDEKEGGAARPPFLINNFHEVLDSCDLGDLGCSGDRFTWCNGRKGVGFVKERLDRFVGNLAWRLLFPIFMVSHLEFWGSDHCPILIEFDVCERLVEVTQRGRDRRHRFHFEECWTVYPECEKIVQQNWGSCSNAKSLAAVSAQIRNCAEVLQVWNMTNFHHLKNKIAENRHILQSVSSDLSGSSWQTIQVVEKELDVLLYKEELYWRQRSRNNWLKGGDRNTRFFHQAASSRRRRNFIHGLRDSSRQWVSSRSGIIGIIQGYYRSLFTSATGRSESPSFVWRSLLWGRDLIELGSRWRIGDGTSTFVMCSAMRSSTFSFLEFFVWCCSNLMMDDIRLLVTNLKMEVKDIVSWAICYLNDFDDANNKHPYCQSNQHSVKWKRPPEDWYKLNVDASLKAADNLVGLGAVVRDYQGLFMAGLSRKLVGSVSIEVAEAAAILNGLHLALQSGFSRLLVESDSSTVINYILRHDPPRSEVGLIISDILTLCSTALVEFAFVPRCANCVAHQLARNSFSIEVVSIWLEDAPPWLEQGLLSDSQA
ncbi:hypothetical protein ACOSQ2_002861 [Xanthoceras sorbifolium]